MSGKYGDADGYDQYMGGWSAALSPPFLDFAATDPVASVLDVGCGTGNLLAAIVSRHPRAALTGIDPSEALLSRARERPVLAGARLVTGGVEALPFADRSFSHTLSMLVLQEFTDRDHALSEMARVTAAGGIVAGCQWDFDRMPVIAALVEAITAVDAAAGARLDRRASPVFHDEAELTDCWRRAALRDVTAGRITVERRFPSFEAVWQPLLAGSTPSTLTLASLPDAQRQAVRALMIERLAVRETKMPLTLTAEALVARGTV